MGKSAVVVVVLVMMVAVVSGRNTMPEGSSCMSSSMGAGRCLSVKECLQALRIFSRIVSRDQRSSMRPLELIISRSITACKLGVGSYGICCPIANREQSSAELQESEDVLQPSQKIDSLEDLQDLQRIRRSSQHKQEAQGSLQDHQRLQRSSRQKLVSQINPQPHHRLRRTIQQQQGDLQSGVLELPAQLNQQQSDLPFSRASRSLPQLSDHLLEQQLQLLPQPARLPRSVIPENLTIPPALQVSLDTCGTSIISDKLIDGIDAKLFTFPWTVLIRGRDGPEGVGREAFHCGGTLITWEHVITAGHCIRDPGLPELEVLNVRVGEHHLGTQPDCSLAIGLCMQSEDINIHRIHIHPDYNVKCNACSDIAIIKLQKSAANLAPYVNPLCLPLNPLGDLGASIANLQNSGKRATITGWGSVVADPYSTELPLIMQQAYVPLYRNAFCNASLATYPNADSIICAGGEGPDVCRGDSGGPLQMLGQQASRWYLLGVTSKGPENCGAPTTQSLYSNVYFYLDWVLETLGK